MVGDCLVGPVIKALWYFVPSAAPRTDGIFLWPTAHGRNEIPAVRCYDFAVIKVPRGQGRPRIAPRPRAHRRGTSARTAMAAILASPARQSICLIRPMVTPRGTANNSSPNTTTGQSTRSAPTPSPAAPAGTTDKKKLEPGYVWPDLPFGNRFKPDAVHSQFRRTIPSSALHVAVG